MHWKSRDTHKWFGDVQYSADTVLFFDGTEYILAGIDCILADTDFVLVGTHYNPADIDTAGSVQPDNLESKPDLIVEQLTSMYERQVLCSNLHFRNHSSYSNWDRESVEALLLASEPIHRRKSKLFRVHLQMPELVQRERTDRFVLASGSQK